MKRHQIIERIGAEYLSSNVEEEEFRYPKEFENKGKDFGVVKVTNKNRSYERIDLRFVDENRGVVVLVETKENFDKDKDAQVQLSAYMKYEQVLTGYAIIGILANTDDDRIRVWRDNVSEATLLEDHYEIRSFGEYCNIVKPIITNNKEEIIKNTYDLNDLLHTYSIPEKLRSQFVGTCLVALKSNLVYKGLKTSQIIAGIHDILEAKLSKKLSKAEKLAILDLKILKNQHVKSLSEVYFEKILNNIETKILPYINDETTKGQDLLNLFFTTFNKYVGKSDKNQAFTPDHIVHFMCKVLGVNRNSRVLDPCCGSGAFLVRAMTEALNDCQTDDERDAVYNNNIYGIEYEENAFGLATTNMLIHNDGNTNIIQGSCFKNDEWIKEAKIDCVLMNPPYNAQRAYCKDEYVETWKKGNKGKEKKEDPSKGFHFVHHIASVVKKGKLAVLLPMQCAIGTSSEIKSYKEKMLKDHRLDAVFSLPADIFHPGASANVCCMVFELGVRHKDSTLPTFFGYYKEDGFRKRKNLGRVEMMDSQTGTGLWAGIEKKWLKTYFERQEITGLSALKKVSYKDEWLCEAYMKTDYTNLSINDFERTVRDYVAYCISSHTEDEIEDE